MKKMYVVIWTKRSGLEIKKRYASTDAEKVFQRYNQYVKQAGLGLGDLVFGSADSLLKGQTLITAGLPDVIHAFPVDDEVEVG